MNMNSMEILVLIAFLAQSKQNGWIGWNIDYLNSFDNLFDDEKFLRQQFLLQDDDD